MADKAIAPQPPGSTKQDVQTPKIFLDAVKLVWGDLVIDWAADCNNVCDIWFGKSDDSLTLPWAEIQAGMGSESEWTWLNPSFGLSKTFIPKCSYESRLGAKVISIVQTATSSNYWNEWVLGNSHCQIILLNGRVPFVGYAGGANIDCSLLIWAKENETLEVADRILTWNWKKENARPKRLWQ